MHERHRRGGPLVAQVAVEGAELVADQHALVVDRARGAGGHVQARRLGVQLEHAADHVQLALERLLVLGETLSGADEQLPDDRTAGARDLTRLLGVDRHLPPAQHDLALGGDRALQLPFQRRPVGVVDRQEAHQHPVAPERRQLEADRRTEQLVWDLHQDAGAVACARVGPGGAAVLEILQRRQRLRDHLVRGLVVQARDHADAARVVLEGRVVETDGLWRLRDVRMHGSGPLGRCIPRDTDRWAPEAEQKGYQRKACSKTAV